MATNEATEQANRSGMTPSRLIVLFLLSSAIVLALFLQHVLGLLWARLNWPDPDVLEGIDWKLTTILGVLLSAGLALGAFFHPLPRQWLTDVANELMKVTWPSWSETRTSTMAVVVASLLAAMLLFGIDTLSYKLMVDWLPALWGKL